MNGGFLLRSGKMLHKAIIARDAIGSTETSPMETAMTKTCKTLALSALAGLAALAAIPSAANAEDMHRRHKPDAEAGIVIEFGKKHGPEIGVVIDPFDHGHMRRHDRHDMFDKRFVVRKAPRCSPDQAMWKASNVFNLRRVHVEYANKHVIGVEGKKHGQWYEIVFSRAPGCPVIDY
jgi:hypothetical protein